MFDDWVVIYSTSQMYEAEIIKSMMEDQSMECVIMNKQDSTYRFGDIELYVPTAEALKAKQLILDFKSE